MAKDRYAEAHSALREAVAVFAQALGLDDPEDIDHAQDAVVDLIHDIADRA